MNSDTYRQCLEEMYGLRRFGIILGLDVISGMMSRLGRPHERFASIHVAGTNGKGSIASALANILFRAGYKAGLYTSPHLVRFNERIRINNREISNEEVVECYRAVKNANRSEREATFFEYSTAMAFYAFANAGVDYAVVETGMGGRLDATNILQPEITIISNISMEHSYYLGRTIREIAGEKAGIIKERTPVVTGARQKAAVDVIRKKAGEKHAPFYRFGEQFRVRRDKHSKEFNYYGINNRWPGMKARLAGSYQVDNAAVVLAASELLAMKGRVDFPAVREGLDTHQWPGRLELLPTSPPILIDGAHNLMAARNLAEYLEQETGNRRITAVIGILDDKPYRAMLRAILPNCSRVILTRARIGRSLPPETLYRTARNIVSRAEVVPNVADALTSAWQSTGPEDLVCIAGSLYVVGEAKEAIEEMRAGGSFSSLTVKG